MNLHVENTLTGFQKLAATNGVSLQALRNCWERLANCVLTDSERDSLKKAIEIGEMLIERARTAGDKKIAEEIEELLYFLVEAYEQLGQN